MAPDPSWIELGRPSAYALGYCGEPASPPADFEAMPAAAQEDDWTTDRAGYVDCGRRHYELVRWILGRLDVFGSLETRGVTEVFSDKH